MFNLFIMKHIIFNDPYNKKKVVSEIDNENQLLEVLCENNLLSYGIILSKGNEIADIDDTKIQFYITHMKECMLDEVLIPTFTHDTKIRFNNTFKKMGLNSVFMKIVSPKLFPEGVVLQDVVQNIKIIIDNTYSDSNNDNHNMCYKSNRKFIANKKFIYYFRMLKTNTILLIGQY